MERRGKKTHIRIHLGSRSQRGNTGARCVGSKRMGASYNLKTLRKLIRTFSISHNVQNQSEFLNASPYASSWSRTTTEARTTTVSHRGVSSSGRGTVRCGGQGTEWTKCTAATNWAFTLAITAERAGKPVRRPQLAGES